MQETKYIEGLLRGDTTLIRSIYRQYVPKVAGYIQRWGGSKQDVEDIFQDALMIIYNKAQQEDFQLTSSFYAYLLGICQRLWYNKKKKKANQMITLEQNETYMIDDQSIVEEMITLEKQQLLDDNLQNLSAVCRQILTMGAKGSSIKEIMTVLGLNSETYTRTRKARCKKKLIELIKNDPRLKELF